MENIINITPENFQQIILEASQEKLIMVDFWADWCEPCKSLIPILEKLAAQYSNDLILAKVNCDEQQAISMQFGVRNLPTVIFVKDGQPVDGFAGLHTEQQIREMLEKHLPSQDDALYQQALMLCHEKNFSDAFTAAKQAHELAPERADIKILLAGINVELGKIEQAKELISTIGLVDQDAQYQAVLSKIELAEQAADTPEIQALQKMLEDDPDNMETKVSLAVQLHQANRSGEALDLLFQVLRKDLNFGEAKKFALDIINALPEGDELASKFRRKIYSLMY
ncbi:thioredoxin [Paraneptunicella aestuarii]|uniref:thioredoxin n=1 Tax=Paraneptunicella aestuarii TaxID=2831148 RepID=UPI001E62740D|nr:thioredoxin [Paraneptunicella aestuarii]UAA38300.1 thioredoxin [Paraneptunicella aestuarii]